MSLSIQHVRHARLVRTSYATINQARLDVQDHRGGEITDYWEDMGGSGFLFQHLDLASYSIFLEDSGVIYEVVLFSHYPVD